MASRAHGVMLSVGWVESMGSMRSVCGSRGLVADPRVRLGGQGLQLQQAHAPAGPGSGARSKPARTQGPTTTPPRSVLGAFELSQPRCHWITEPAGPDRFAIPSRHRNLQQTLVHHLVGLRRHCGSHRCMRDLSGASTALGPNEWGWNSVMKQFDYSSDAPLSPSSPACFPWTVLSVPAPPLLASPPLGTDWAVAVHLDLSLAPDAAGSDRGDLQGRRPRKQVRFNNVAPISREHSKSRGVSCSNFRTWGTNKNKVKSNDKNKRGASCFDFDRSPAPS
jgi:hypothetical protein